MAGIRVEGNTSGNVAEVNAANQLKVALPQEDLNAGKAVIMGQQGDGTYTGGVPARRAPRVSGNYRLAVGQDTPLLEYNFNATAQDSGLWKYAFTTMTAAQTGGLLQLNSGTIGTTGTGVYFQTWRTFSCLTTGGLRIQAACQLSGAIPTNQVIEVGLFNGTITTAPADGVYIRLTNAGIIGVLNFNGTETPITFDAAAVTAFMAPSTNFVLEMVIYNDVVSFYIEGAYLGKVDVPAANPFPFLTASLPLTFQQRNTGTVTGASQFKVGACSVSQVDANIQAPFSHQQGAMGGMCSQSQSGSTMGSSALYTNSLAPGAGAAMTNTAASLGAGLGGQFAALPTLAANTDGIVCSYANPVGTVAIEPRILMITGVRIQSVVTTALTGGPLIYLYSLAYGHSAVSLATAEATSFTTNPSTKAPRRVPLGIESIVVTAAVGALGSVAGQYMAFNSPIAVNPGEFVAVVAKNVGTVTTLGVVTFLVTFDGYWI